MIWNYLEALLKRHSMYSLIVAYGKKGKREITANDDIPQFTLQRAHCQEHRIWMSHMKCECSIAIVTKQKAPPLSARKGSFEGHWSGSYCPGGRQIGPVKPHCESDWNWFVVLLLHHPIKRRNLRESEREIAWETGVAVLVEEGEADSEGKMRAKEGGLTMAH